MRWQKILLNKKHEFFDLYDQKISFSSVNIAQEDSVKRAMIEICADWINTKKVHFFELNLREVESFLRDHNHIAILSENDFVELKQKLDQIGLALVTLWLESDFGSDFEDSSLVEKIKFCNQFLSKITSLSHSSEVIELIDIEDPIVLIDSREKGTLFNLLIEASKNVSYVSFLAEKENQG